MILQRTFKNIVVSTTGVVLLLDDMTKTALKQPEMLEALIRATEAKEVLESERKLRCEGGFLFCW